MEKHRQRLQNVFISLANSIKSRAAELRPPTRQEVLYGIMGGVAVGSAMFGDYITKSPEYNDALAIGPYASTVILSSLIGLSTSLDSRQQRSGVVQSTSYAHEDASFSVHTMQEGEN